MVRWYFEIFIYCCYELLFRFFTDFGTIVNTEKRTLMQENTPPYNLYLRIKLSEGDKN